LEKENRILHSASDAETALPTIPTTSIYANTPNVKAGASRPGFIHICDWWAWRGV